MVLVPNVVWMESSQSAVAQRVGLEIPSYHAENLHLVRSRVIVNQMVQSRVIVNQMVRSRVTVNQMVRSRVIVNQIVLSSVTVNQVVGSHVAEYL